MKSDTMTPFWRAITELTPGLEDADRVKELRRITGVKQPTVSRWRTGAAPIGNRNALKIARHYKCNVHWLQTYESERNAPDDNDHTVKELRGILDKMSPQDRAEIVAIARVLARRKK